MRDLVSPMLQMTRLEPLRCGCIAGSYRLVATGRVWRCIEVPSAWCRTHRLDDLLEIPSISGPALRARA